jgi:hypothetical protein
MLRAVSERTMHKVRWFLLIGWLLLILSLFFDPISLGFTASNTGTLLSVNQDHCNVIQGRCQREMGYQLGARLFWAAIVPSSIFILHTFGAGLWRRICPLSFLSQLPLALGIQRRVRHIDAKSGRVRDEVPKIQQNSWLGRNYLYFQFALLYLGLCMRLLFINGDRTALATFLLFTIAAAIFVGYWFSGKTWCHYFCPMAPVQIIFAEPGGLLTPRHSSGTTKDASQGAKSLTQSTCRIVEDGKEKSACVGCQAPCIDINSERSYLKNITRQDRKFIYYAYIGLVFGFYFYFYLYSGNWDYYFSAQWTHEKVADTLWNPGFYLFRQPVPIPRLIAVPLTLASFSILTCSLGFWLEKAYKAYLYKAQKYKGPQDSQHKIFTICTFISFNLFFFFGGRPTIILLPEWFQYLYNTLIIVVSSLCLLKSWYSIKGLKPSEVPATKLKQGSRSAI